MIADCGRGSNVGGLIRYLYGPGETNEHTNPRLIASWLGDDPAILARLEPGGAGVQERDCAALSGQLRYPVDTFGGPDQYVWHVPIAVSADEGALTDAQWALAARRVLERTGVARAADPAACRWVVVHHGLSAAGNDHVHLVATLVRQDGRTEKAWNDWPRSRAAVMEVEAELGLRPTPGRDRTADKAVSRAEVQKAARAGAAEPARAWLRREVRTAAAMSTSRADFSARLEAAGAAVRWRESTVRAGELTGYAVGRPGDVTSEGGQVWFGGSKLAPDLALPRLEARWREGGGPSTRGSGEPSVPAPRRPLTAEERADLLVRTARALERAAGELETVGASPKARRRSGAAPLVEGGVRAKASSDAAGLPAPQQAQAISAAEVASSLARVVEGREGGPLTDAAAHLARAARGPHGRRPDMRRRVHGLRDVAAGVALLGAAVPGDAGAVLTIAAHLTRIADALDRLGRPGAADAAIGLRAWASVSSEQSAGRRVQERAAARQPTSTEPETRRKKATTAGRPATTRGQESASGRRPRSPQARR